MAEESMPKEPGITRRVLLDDVPRYAMYCRSGESSCAPNGFCAGAEWSIGLGR